MPNHRVAHFTADSKSQGRTFHGRCQITGDAKSQGRAFHGRCQIAEASISRVTSLYTFFFIVSFPSFGFEIFFVNHFFGLSFLGRLKETHKQTRPPREQRTCFGALLPGQRVYHQGSNVMVSHAGYNTSGAHRIH